MENQKKPRHDRRKADGQYRIGNRCEVCHKPTGDDYFSDERCNRLGGVGVVLCEKDAVVVAAMSDEDFVAKLRR